MPVGCSEPSPFMPASPGGLFLCRKSDMSSRKVSFMSLQTLPSCHCERSEAISRGQCHRRPRLPRRCAPRNDIGTVIANAVKQSQGVWCHRRWRLPRRCAPRNDIRTVIANAVKQSQRVWCHRRPSLPRRCAPRNDIGTVIANGVKQSQGVKCHRRPRLPRRCAPRNDR